MILLQASIALSNEFPKSMHRSNESIEEFLGIIKLQLKSIL